MRPRVDPTRCRGFGICRELAPGYFTPDDWGLAQAADGEVAEDDHPAVDHAIASCPYQAIRWLPPGARSYESALAGGDEPTTRS